MNKARTLFCLASAMALFACGDDGVRRYQGYVEGEYVIVAAPDSGWLIQLAVEAGQQVKVGDVLFVLEDTREQAGMDAAQARLDEARARLENLEKGRRTEEVSLFDPQITAAEANLRFASAEYERQQKLAKADASARRKVEETRALQRTAAARLDELRLSRNVALLPAREDEIAAARAAVAAAGAQLREAEWRLDQRRIKARVAGMVEDLVRRAGEFAPANGGVVSLLPPENIKIRFFVPETALANMKPGNSVVIHCDSCPENSGGKISFISSEAEFTPPVIYSVDNREKLVFMIEAKPSAYGSYFRPGLPVDVSLPP